MSFSSVLRFVRGHALLPAALAAGGLAWEQGQHTNLSSPPVDAAVWPQTGAISTEPVFNRLAIGHIPMPAQTPAAHASTLVAMPEGAAAGLLAFWFAGQKESAPNVQIAYSWFDRSTQAWQPARFVLNKETAGAALGFGVRRLGNPVAWLDAQARVHLFVVATGLGGWAAGRVLHLVQKQPFRQDAKAFDAIKFEAIGVLPLSWLWNTSTLVRSAPLPLSDGGMLLPLYFELGIKYPIAARFDATGQFIGTQRISSQNGLLQPSLLMLDSRRWLALMRDHGPARKVAVARTDDGGAHWQDLPALPLDNPDASVVGLGLQPGLMVLAHNPSTTGREKLELSASPDGQSWRSVAMLAEGAVGSEYSYPAMTWADGSLWISYTDQRQRIAWQRWHLNGVVDAAAKTGAKP
ncbi:MAG: exo-alpha-sialidase [Betaproteobacteria bacterium]|nr:exo-alpha-sialidase [Betaproteobacteria bacterium]